jgi:uncharacterized delta-60 repeat protein
MKTSGITSRPALVAALVVTLMLAGPRPALAGPGDIDTTFGTGGRVTTDFAGNFDFADGVLAQSNGKIVAVGYAHTETPFEASDFAVARYLANGDPDTSFSGDGRKRTDFDGFGDQATAVARQADGKLVVVGSSDVAASDSRMAVVRYTTGGSLDTTFSGDGKVRTGFTGLGSSSASDVAIQPDGKIVVVGNGLTGAPHHRLRPAGGPGVGSDIAVARFKANGALDASFSGDGRVTTNVAGFDSATAVVVLPSGKIVVAGRSQTDGGEQRIVAVRYLPGGAPDPAFSGDGTVVVNLVPGEPEGAAGVGIRSDGRIVIGAWANNGVDGASGNDLAAAVLSSGGALYLPFGGGDGKAFADFGADESPDEMLRQDDGKLVYVATRPFVSGGDPQAIWVFRLTSGGAADGGFGVAGRAEVEFAGGAGGFAIDVDTEGRAVAAGRVGLGSAADFALTRLQS